MAFEFLSKFTPDSIKESFSSFLVKAGSRLGYTTGLTLEETQAEFNNRGWGRYSNTIASGFIQAQQNIASFEHILNVPSDELLNPNSLVDTSWVTDKFGYVVEYDVYDINGKFVGTQTSRLDSEHLMSVDDILSQSRDWIYDVSGIQVHSSSNVRVKGALKNSLFFDPDTDDWLV